ncbi:MAG: glycosyltransferase [Opitutales bacterium]|nr:glycosyltransferase [Opitutales bacterium]
MSELSEVLDSVGGIFSPHGQWIVPNLGYVDVEGWGMRDSRGFPEILRVKIGKRVLDVSLSECVVGELDATQESFVFQTSFKVGKSLKRAEFFWCYSDGNEVKFSEIWIWQKDKVEPAPSETGVNDDGNTHPGEHSEYEEWYETEHHLILDKIQDDREAMVFPTSLGWVVESNKGNTVDFKQTIYRLLVQLRKGTQLYVADSANCLGLSERKALAKHPRLKCLDDVELDSLESQIEEDWICFLREGDRIENRFLPGLDYYLNANPDVRFVYCDFDRIGSNGSLSSPSLLPSWNRDLLTSYPYMGDFFVIRRDWFIALGGFDSNGDSHRNWAFQLKMSRAAKREYVGKLTGVYVHLAQVPVDPNSERFRRFAKPILQDHLKELGSANAEVLEETDHPGLRIKYSIVQTEAGFPRVSLLIPTRDMVDILSTTVDTILDQTTYPNYQIIVLDNDSEKPETLEYFEKIKERGCKILPCPGKFNYSQINNRGSMAADGELVGFLNNDLEVIDGEWLSEMVSQAMRPGVGAVGPKLLYPDGRLQHTGVLLGVGHVAAHAFRLFENDPKNGPVRAHVCGNFSAVTAACLIVKREIFKEVGGFDDVDLAITNNDVDLCIKIREAGYRNLYTPYAVLKHHESASRGPEDTPEKLERYTKEVKYMWETWGSILIDDPAYNRLLTRFCEDFSLSTVEQIDRYTPGELF